MLWEVRESESEGMYLVPASQEAADWLLKQDKGEAFEMLKPKAARSPQQHNKFWAVARLVYANWPEKYNHPYNAEHLVAVTKCAVGYCWDYESPGGVHYKNAKSINYANMDGEEFTEFFDKCLTLWARILKCSPDDLTGEAEQ